MVFWNQIYNSCCSVCASNPLLIVLMIVIPPILFYFIVYIIRKNELVDEFKQFEGFKFSHKTEKVPESEIIDRSKNSHFILYGSTGSGKLLFWNIFNKK